LIACDPSKLREGDREGRQTTAFDSEQHLAAGK
jgi:hypothetical protein